VSPVINIGYVRDHPQAASPRTIQQARNSRIEGFLSSGR
jgi:hypothetical protein